MTTRKSPSFWRRHREAELRRMYQEGMKDPEIAVAMGTSVNAIRVHRCHMGLVCRKIKRASIRDYTTAALLTELTRRVGPLPEKLWSRAPRKLAPEMAGGIVNFS